MRWFLGVLLILIGLSGALVGAGLLLPTRLETQVSATIERPRATVFALVNNLGALADALPVRQKDPGAALAFEGPPRGEGQIMRWSSDVEDLGAGTVRIVGVKELAQVRYEIARPGAPKAQAVFDIEPIGQDSPAVNVSWRFVSECDAAIEALPCRYSNLLMRRSLKEQLAGSLRRLERMAERLPEADFETLQVSFVEAKSQTYVYVEGETPNDPARIEQAVGIALDKVRAYVELSQLRTTGPAIAIATRWEDDVYAFRAGAPFTGPAPIASLEVRVGQTPAGPSLKVVHEGDSSTLDVTYNQLEAYLAANRIEAVGGPWQVFVSGADQGGPARMEIWRRIEG